MNDKQIIAFITIAEKGSFYKAAQALYLSPQTLVQQMNQLETEIQAPLFFRTKKGTALTQAGSSFYQDALELRDAIYRAVQNAQSIYHPEKASIRIGLSEHPGIIQEISLEFSIEHPEIDQIILPFTQGNSLLNLLCDEKADVIETSSNDDLKKFQIDFQKCVSQRRWCIISPAHPLASKSQLFLNDLEGHEVHVHNLNWLQSLMDEISENNYDISLTERPCTFTTVFDVCIHGGIYLVPQYYATNFEPLAAIPLQSNSVWDFGLAFRAQHSETVSMFLKTASKLFT